MHAISVVLVALMALLHAYILVLEMFLWQSGPGRSLSGFDAELARATAPLAANQGLYNGFLAAGLVWGLIADDPTGRQVQIFFLSCMVVAACLRRGHRQPPHPLRPGPARSRDARHGRRGGLSRRPGTRPAP